MNPTESPDIIEEEEISLFKTETLHNTPKNQRKHSTNSHSYQSTVISIFLILIIALFSLYLIERKDREVSSRIASVKNSQMHQLPSKKGTTIAPKTEAGRKEDVIEDVNYELFEDEKVTKTRNAPGQGYSPLQKADSNNPIMKTYLQGVNQTLKKSENVNDLISEMLQNKNKDKLVIPKKIWIYSENQEQENQFVKACLENTRKVANKSGFSVFMVSPANFQEYISEERALLFNQTVSVLVKESVNNPISGYDAVIPNIKKELALLQILHQQGGIIMDSNVVLTEDLSWLIEVPTNQYANCGNPEFPTKYFGFHNINFTSNEQKYVNKDGTWKFICNYVGLQSFFLAGMPKEQFLTQILKVMHICFVNPQSTRSTLSVLKIGKAITNIFIVTNAFPIACRIVLKEKEKLSEKGLLAIDYFGLKTINSQFFPKKLQHYFQSSFQDKIFRNLGSLTLQQLEQNVGPLKYMAIVPYETYINEGVQKILAATLSAENGQIPLFNPNSFLIKYLYQNVDKNYLQTEIEENQPNPRGELWSALPKIIWTQKPKNSERNLIEKAIFDNVKRQALKDGFQLREVDPSNFGQWLDKYEIDWIKNTVDKAKIKVYDKLKMEIAKLHILIRYGGVWLSKHFFTLSSFQWLPKIKEYPSQSIFNRYGEFPQVIMYFHPHYGQPFEWSYDSTANTKNMWHVALDSNFIAAEPEAQLLKDWVRILTKFLTRPYGESLSEMSRLRVDTERWTVKENSFFASLDAVKTVMVNKQRQINNLVIDNDTYIGSRSSPEFYQVWSISGAQGPLKLDSSFASLAVEKGDLNPKSNSLIWRYPQNYTQGIVGKIHKMSKIYHMNTIELLRVCQNELKGSSQSEIHPQSIFSNFLMGAGCQSWK